MYMQESQMHECIMQDNMQKYHVQKYHMQKYHMLEYGMQESQVMGCICPTNLSRRDKWHRVDPARAQSVNN
jgi:CO dehydrogenase nickel-insertion accessory protein CooC1